MTGVEDRRKVRVKMGRLKGWQRAIGVGVLACLALVGCSKGETAEDIQGRVEPAILAVPGVTGGTVTVGNAGVSSMYTCALTSDRADQEELKAVLVDVLKTLVSQTPNEPAGQLVTCSVSNADLGVATQDLGLTSPSSLREIREKIG